jgi:hypothetical protein
MIPSKMKNLAVVLTLLPSVLALGQKATVSLTGGKGMLQLAGNGINGQILLSANDWWGVIRAAQDLAGDMGKVSGQNLTLGNWVAAGGKTPSRDVPASAPPSESTVHPSDEGPGEPPLSSNHSIIQSSSNGKTTVVYTYKPVVGVGPEFVVGPAETFTGPTLVSNSKAKTVIIAGTIGKSDVINKLVSSGKLNPKPVQGQWEAFISQVVTNPLPGVDRALVIAGADQRGTIFGLYDVSEQIGVSPWWWFADVPVSKAAGIWAMGNTKVQGSPSVKYRGLFINDEQPALTNWIK